MGIRWRSGRFGPQASERAPRFRQLEAKPAKLVHERELFVDDGERYGEAQSSGMRRVALDLVQSGVWEQQSGVGHTGRENRAIGLRRPMVSRILTTLRAAATGSRRPGRRWKISCRVRG